jgi:rhodanese-related sulfurtransferase
MRWRRWLAGAAALAGALAPFAGSPYRSASAGSAGEDRTHATARAAMTAAGQESNAVAQDRSAAVQTSSAAGQASAIDVAELARAVAEQEDHVSAVELAAWLRARRPGLRVIDLRTADEFAAYHIPGAEHVPLEQLASVRFAADDTIVLYSEMGVHGGQGWVFLRALGHRHVVFLRNGLHEWLEDVMSPTIAADAPAAAQAEFDRVAELSRWFGGTPRRLGGPATATVSDGSAVAPTTARRRGC